MSQEHRRDLRYRSSQKAVLLNEGAAGSLCVITNLSTRGLCLAVVGASGPGRREKIDLKVNRGTFLCNVVNRGKEGLHCRFDDLIDDPDLWKNVQPKPEAAPGRDMIARHDTYDRNGMWRSPGAVMEHAQYRYSLTRIYSEGCFVGREQIDASAEFLDSTVNALNPYHAPDEKERWASGFMDAVRHMIRQSGPS